MDAAKLALLKADINAQRMTIDRIFTMLEDRAANLSVESSAEKLESVAYQLHNLYGAVEDLFKVIATYFENNISDSAQWHSRLLQRMTQAVEGVRPAVIRQDSYLQLNSLRGFRQFFRHAYGVTEELAKLSSNLEQARLLKPLLNTDLDAFFR
jgi:AraC-like DNA-binding protein